MQNPNFKLYLGISFALVIIFILIIIIPFSKKTTNTSNSTPSTFPVPTSVIINNNSSLNTTPANSTGVVEEELPQAIVDAATQKQDLRSKLPVSLSSFSIDFNYSEDKFVVTLNEPKDQSRIEFNQWKSNTYPGIDINQFNFQ